MSNGQRDWRQLQGNYSIVNFSVVWQTRNIHLSRDTLYLLSPRLCFFIVLKSSLFFYCDDSLTS